MKHLEMAIAIVKTSASI